MTELGSERSIELAMGTLRYRERGEGEPVVFIHGVLMNADTWHEPVPLLAERHRCICPDWPTGGHTVGLAAGAGVSPSALAEMVAQFVENLELEHVTLVGIGLGTVLCELLAIRHPERIGRIVFGPGDILSTFPPGWARRRFAVAFVPPVATVAVRALSVPAVRRRAFAQFRRAADDNLAESFTHGLRNDHAVRRDTLKLMRAICRGRTGNVHDELAAFRKPALVLWGRDDEAFPASHPEELAEKLPDVRIEQVDGAKTFLAEDAPQAFAEAIDRFIASTPVSASTAGT